MKEIGATAFDQVMNEWIRVGLVDQWLHDH